MDKRLKDFFESEMYDEMYEEIKNSYYLAI